MKQAERVVDNGSLYDFELYYEDIKIHKRKILGKMVITISAVAARKLRDSRPPSKLKNWADITLRRLFRNSNRGI